MAGRGVEDEEEGIMTERDILQICVKHDRDGMYRTPELNDKLYLHFKGYSKIGGLTKYTGLRVLWLEGNAIGRIENLDTQLDLRTLYLHQNVISKLENLEHLVHLDLLNLADNFIHRIENLSKLTNLQTLTLTNNKVKDLVDVEHLAECTSLRVVDLSHNHIEDPDVMTIFEQMPHLTMLKLEGNPVVRKVPHYRRTTISRLPALRHLDDRPIFDDERRLAEAWCRGGVEEEKRERAIMRKEEDEKRQANMAAFDALVEEGRKTRAEYEARGEEVPHTQYYLMNHRKPDVEVSDKLLDNINSSGDNGDEDAPATTALDPKKTDDGNNGDGDTPPALDAALEPKKARSVEEAEIVLQDVSDDDDDDEKELDGVEGSKEKGEATPVCSGLPSGSEEKTVMVGDVHNGIRPVVDREASSEAGTADLDEGRSHHQSDDAPGEKVVGGWCTVNEEDK